MPPFPARALPSGRRRRVAGLVALAAAVAWTLAPAARPGAGAQELATAGAPVPPADPASAPLAPPDGTAILGPSAPRSLLGGPIPLDFASVADQDLSDQATLETRSPTVEWSAAGARGWDIVATRQTVRAGDRVRTGSGGAARLTYFEGSVTDLSPDTSLIVQRLERTSNGNIITSLFQSAGTTVSRVLRLTDASAGFEVDTPAATAFVRGTMPRVTVSQDGRTTRVENVPDGTGGFVDVRGHDSGQTSVRLAPNQQTDVQFGQPPGPPVPMNQSGQQTGGGTGDAAGGTAPPPGAGPAAVIVARAGSRVVAATIPVPPPASVPPVVGRGTIANVPPSADATASVTADLGDGARATVLLPGDPRRSLAVRVAAAPPAASAPGAPAPLGLSVDVYDASSGAAVSTPLTLGVLPPRGADPTTVVVGSQARGDSQTLSGRFDPASGVLQVQLSS